MTDTDTLPGLQASTFPYGRLSVAAGQTISSAWGNTTFDQTMQAFASASDRANQWPAPNEGAQSWLMDSHTPWIFRAGAWHGLPLGYIASLAGPATAINAGASLTTIISLSANVVAGRWYQVNANIFGTQQTAASTSVRYAVTPSPLINGYFGASASLAANAPYPAGASYMWQAPSTAAQAFVIQSQTNAGTMLHAINSASLGIQDIGG